MYWSCCIPCKRSLVFCFCVGVPKETSSNSSALMLRCVDTSSLQLQSGLLYAESFPVIGCLVYSRGHKQLMNILDDSGLV